MSKKKTTIGLAVPFAVQLYIEDASKLENHAKKNRQSKGRSTRDAVSFAFANGFGK